jgi:photosystem II stability/assembly factor-like uncharacterized protein
MKKLSLMSLLQLLVLAAVSQSGFTTLSIPPQGRYDDIFFINDSTGWVAGGYGINRTAKIYRTNDGGDTWKVQFTVNKYLRSIEFATDKIGYCGSLDSALFKTTDGGDTWTDITAALPVRPTGICGISIPNPSVIFAVGKYSGPGFVIKSIDGGATWSHIDMSAYSNGLVDVLFLNKDTGYVSGRSPQGGILLYTSNGGSTWTVKYKTGVAGEYIWKIQTPDYKNFFASIDGLPNNNCRFLKSTDAGTTWNRIFALNRPAYIQGIGFIDENTGWLGSDDKLYKTTDGGSTWAVDSFRAYSFNRFCRINKKIAYLAGEQVYRYNALTAGGINNAAPDPVHYLNVMPNPTRGYLQIQPVFKFNTYAMLTIYNAAGVEVAQLLNQYVKAGSKTTGFNFGNRAAGTYYVVLRTNEGVLYKTVVKQ